MKNRYILSPSFLDESILKLESLAKSDWLINKPPLPSLNKQLRISAIHKPLADLVFKEIITGNRPISIAGDCCSAIGVLAGLQKSGVNPFLIWFDAHGDFNTWETTESGFLGGMPLAMIVGRGDQTMPKAIGLKAIAENRIILTDARDLDPGERKLLETSEIAHLTNVKELLEYSLPAGPLYVHFDCDVVSPEESPAQNYPAYGGPSSSLMHSVFSRLAKSKQIAAVSLSSWNPELDKDKKSEIVSLSLLNTLIG